MSIDMELLRPADITDLDLLLNGLSDFPAIR